MNKELPLQSTRKHLLYGWEEQEVGEEKKWFQKIVKSGLGLLVINP